MTILSCQDKPAQQQRTCSNCGEALQSSHPAAKYCSQRECKNAAKKARAARAPRCSVNICDKRVEARGLCHSHYVARRRTTLRVNIGDCKWCGEAVHRPENPGRERVFCTVDHQNKWMAEHFRKKYSTELVKWAKPERVAPEPQHTRGHVTWIQGKCYLCAGTFITWSTSQITCSAECRDENKRRVQRAKASRRRAYLHDAFVEDVHIDQLIDVYGPRCSLCGDPLAMAEAVPHPLAPTIDHVIPLARGGRHESSNCLPAHFICNSTKRDAVEGSADLLKHEDVKPADLACIVP